MAGGAAQVRYRFAGLITRKGHAGMKVKVRTLLAGGTCAVLLFAGCGGGGDDNSSSSGDGNTTTTAGGDSGNTSGDFDFGSGNCLGVASAIAAAQAGVAGAFTGSLDAEFQDSVDKLQSFAENAPDEIKDDLQVIADTYEQFAQAIQDSGVDLSNPGAIDPADAATLGQALQDIDTDAADAAAQNVEDYVQANCTS